jgi:diguanylate cyclase (GGDEF)-like protein
VALTCTLALVVAARLPAQEKKIPFEHLTLDNGLPANTVNAFLQDNEGFLWIGTQDGLARYDGKRFVVFRNDPSDPGSLSANWIWSLLLDRDGTIWIGTDGGGLDRWDPASQSFRNLRNDESNPNSLSNDRIRVVHQDSKGILWVGTQGGLNRLDPASGRIKRFIHDPSNPESLSDNKIRALVEDSEKRLWIGTDGGGIDLFQPETGDFKNFRHDPSDAGSLSENRVRAIYEDSAQRLWVGTYEQGVDLFDPETGSFEHFIHQSGDPASLSDNRVRAILEDSRNVLWVGTDKGLNEWVPGRAGFSHYLHNPTDPTSISDNRVMALFQDKGGVLWIGTQGGANTWNPLTGSFVGFRSDPQRPDRSLSDNSVNAFTEDQTGSTLWVGTYAGLDRIDRQTGLVTHYRQDDADPFSLRDERVFSLLSDSRGTLWVGTFEGGLHRLESSNGRFINYRHDPTDPRSLSRDAVTVIYEDAKGVIWLGTYGGGLNRYSSDSDDFVSYRHEPERATSLGGDQVLALLEDSTGILWVGTDGAGLTGFDRATGSFIRYRHRPDQATSLSHDTVFSLHEDGEGTLWIGTRGGGLNRWPLADRIAHRPAFKRYTTNDGLPNEVIYGILSDDNGLIWMSTNEGLASFDPRTETFRSFDTSHGLQSREFNFGAAFRSSSGEMFFGTNQGFNSFQPSSLRNNEHLPPIVLTSFTKFNREVEVEGPLSALSDIELSYKDYVVSFEFAALDFTAPHKNDYAYMLEGFDSRWNEVGPFNRATYTNLDPGHYVLRVRGSNNDGVWNNDGLAIRLDVIPPPWQTWWAYALYTLAVVAAIAWYLRRQAHEREQEARQRHYLEKEVAARTRELADRNQDLQKAIGQLEQASVTDALTGLRNRRFLVNAIGEDLELVDRYHEELESNPENALAQPQPDVLFLMFDLDGFKGVNDSQGHAAGDHVLLQVRDILEDSCRKSDTVIRWGGDEFLVIARHTDRGQAERLAERIRRNVENHLFDVGTDVPTKLTCSIGFAYYPFVSGQEVSFSWEQIVTIADRALYVAKKSGRNAWVGLHETAKTRELDSFRLLQLVNEQLDELARRNHLRLETSLTSPEELVWAWS